MNDVVLVSRFNTNNIGDVVIANALREELEKTQNVQPVSLFGSPQPQPLSAPVISYDGSAKSGVINKVFRKVETKNQLTKIRKGNADIIFGGGNMLCDLNPSSHSTLRYKPYIDCGNDRGMSAIDIGIGPFYTDEQKKEAINLLDHMKFITFRDKSSMELYQKSGGSAPCYLSVDPAFFFNHTENKKTELHRTIGINVMNARLIRTGEGVFEKICNQYLNLGVALNKELGVEVNYFITDQADATALSYINAHITNTGLKTVYIRGIQDLLDFYDGIDLLIGTRMHSMILGYSRCLPLIGITWQQKIVDMFEMLEINDRLFEFDEFGSYIGNIVDLAAIIYGNLQLEQKRIGGGYSLIEYRRASCYKEVRRIL